MELIPNEVMRMVFEEMGETSQRHAIQRVCRIWCYLILTLPITPSVIKTVRILYAENLEIAAWIETVHEQKDKQIDSLKHEAGVLRRSLREKNEVIDRDTRYKSFVKSIYMFEKYGNTLNDISKLKKDPELAYHKKQLQEDVGFKLFLKTIFGIDLIKDI